MNLQTLLREMPKSTFIEEHMHRLPFSSAGAARSLCQLGTWDVLGHIVEQEGADLMVVRDGQQYTGPAPRTLAHARGLSQEGYTILVRHAQRHEPRLRELATAFEEDLRAPANIHIYATPAGKHGFSWHYDAEDVFIMQTQGRKQYSLRKNTVHPWPLVETIPQDMRYPSEITPLMRVLLSAGDWLYIPCGYWHKAEADAASDETAISLALGVMSPAAIDIYDFLRPRFLDSLFWRQRLPTSGSASPLGSEELLARYREVFGQLADELNKTLRDERLVAEFLDRLETKYASSQKDPQLP